MRGPDQPPKPTGDPDPRSRPAIQTDPDLTIQTYDPVSWILEKFGHPVPDPFQTSSMESTGSVHSQACCPRRKNRSVRPAQNHLIHFKSYMKWLSWFQALRSRRADKTFYESGRSRRPDHRGTIQTGLSTHAHIYIFFYICILQRNGHLFYSRCTCAQQRNIPQSCLKPSAEMNFCYFFAQILVALPTKRTSPQVIQRNKHLTSMFLPIDSGTILVKCWPTGIIMQIPL